jgi:uroporphyrinogen III methyltransferase / synthase
VTDLAERFLTGKRVVVTRVAAQAIDLLKALQNAGAIPILLPLIRIQPPEDFGPIDGALTQLHEFDWVLFSSQNAVRIIHERMERLGVNTFVNSITPLVGTVGAATATEAQNAGFRVTHVASRPIGAALAQELGESLRGKKVFLPRSDKANPELVATLEKFGAIVTEVVAYRTLAEAAQERDVVAKAMNADALLFFSPSAVEGFDAVCGAGKLQEFSTKGVVLASGPVTQAALREQGIGNASAAKEPSVARIIEALAHSFAMQTNTTLGNGKPQ